MFILLLLIFITVLGIAFDLRRSHKAQGEYLDAILTELRRKP